MDRGKLSEVNVRTESRRYNELVSKFKMAASDLVSVRGQVMEYTYIPTGINGEMQEDRWPFILVDRLFLVLPT